jgi:hypothetical protein
VRNRIDPTARHAILIGEGPHLARHPYNRTMTTRPSTLTDWTPDEVAQAKRWVRTWEEAGPRLEAIRREELRRLDNVTALGLLMGPADYTVPPRAPKPTSGLVEQQRWFMKLFHQSD